jgi:hypothetical protein
MLKDINDLSNEKPFWDRCDANAYNFVKISALIVDNTSVVDSCSGIYSNLVENE